MLYSIAFEFRQNEIAPSLCNYYFTIAEAVATRFIKSWNILPCCEPLASWMKAEEANQWSYDWQTHVHVSLPLTIVFRLDPVFWRRPVLPPFPPFLPEPGLIRRRLLLALPVGRRRGGVVFPPVDAVFRCPTLGVSTRWMSFVFSPDTDARCCCCCWRS